MVATVLKNTEHAYKTIKNHIRSTPLIKATHLQNMPAFACDVHLKLELHQITGSFKARGVLNKILNSDPAHIKNGLFAASGGNHGRAVAFAGAQQNIKTTVVLPTCASQDKINMIAEWGTTTVVEGQDLDESNDIARQLAQEAGGLFIHPYADPVVTLGQGTIGVELLHQLSDLDLIIVAIGGGGLISGVSSYLKAVNPKIKVIGVEPEGCPTLYDSIQAGEIVSVKDITTKVGTLAIRRTTEENFACIQKHVDDIILVSDQDMKHAAEILWYQFGIAGEMSGVASFAGLLSGKIDLSQSQQACALICGQGLPHDFLRTY